MKKNTDIGSTNVTQTWSGWWNFFLDEGKKGDDDQAYNVVVEMDVPVEWDICVDVCKYGWWWYVVSWLAESKKTWWLKDYGIPKACIHFCGTSW